jgi:hypothetical protein
MSKNQINLGRRKIQKQSKTLYIAVPKVAVKMFKLKKGGSMEFILDSKGRLILRK